MKSQLLDTLMAALFILAVLAVYNSVLKSRLPAPITNAIGL